MGGATGVQEGYTSASVTSTKENIGVEHGATIGTSFTNTTTTFGVQIDPMVQYASQHIEYRQRYSNEDYGAGTVSGGFTAKATIYKCPVLLTYSLPLTTKLSSMFGLGVQCGFRMSTKAQGSVSIVSDSGSVACGGAELNSDFLDTPVWGISAMSAVDYVLGRSWTLRTELRLEHDFNPVTIMPVYDIVDARPYTVESRISPTRLTFAVALLFGK